jgi:uncharacterized protein (TIRG00374 family)
LLQNTIKNIDIRYVLGACLVHILAFILLSTRWWILYKAQDDKNSCTKAFKGYYFGLFFNNFLPTGMGGDVVRIIYLRKFGFATPLLISSTLLDRVIGLFSILLMGLIAIAISPKIAVSDSYYVGLVIFSLVAVMSIALASTSRCKDFVHRFILKSASNRILVALKSFLETINRYRNNRQQLLSAVCISLLAQHLVIISYFMIGISLGIDLAFYLYYTIIPIVFITSSLPISIGGLGVREGTLVALFTMYGTTTESAIALSLVYFLVLLSITLPGGIIIWKKENGSIRSIDCCDIETQR